MHPGHFPQPRAALNMPKIENSMPAFFAALSKCAFAIFLAYLLTGCACQRLLVYTAYVNVDTLASSIVNTPDFRQDNPPCGQRLLVSWSIKSAVLKREKPYMYIAIRFRNRQTDTLSFPIEKSLDSYVYNLLDADFKEKLGILTYKVEIWGKSGLIESRHHHLWAELIEIGDNEGPQTEELEERN